MYAVNQCSDPRDFVSPRYKAVKVSVLSSKSIFSVDAKAVTSDVDVQKVKKLVKKLKRKLRRCLVDPNVDIRIKEKTTKLCFFTSTKDKTPQLSQSNVVYKFTCPGCNSSYIGKTNRTLLVRTQEHALTDKESAIYKHLRDCDNIKHIQDLYNLPDVFTNENISSITVINKEFFAQTVRDNTNIIDRDDNWNLSLYKEAYHIKRLTPFLNNGLKASRELRLFS